MRFKCIAVGIVVLAVVGVWEVRPGRGAGANKEGSQDTTDLLRHGEYPAGRQRPARRGETAPRCDPPDPPQEGNAGLGG